MAAVPEADRSVVGSDPQATAPVLQQRDGVEVPDLLHGVKVQILSTEAMVGAAPGG